MGSNDQTTARTALACLDLTSLNDADDEATIERLCARAAGPFGTVAAVCVWPRLAAVARRQAPAGVAVAAVANFPAGGTAIEPLLREIGQIREAGAQEVDLVLPWRALLAGDTRAVAAVVAAARRASEGLRLKLILESGELPDVQAVRAASALGLAEGVDFLKTSTGKTARGADPVAARAMLQAIADDPAAAPRVGFKVSGGVRTVADAGVYLALTREILGPDALNPGRWRIGASGLLADIEAVLGGAPGAATPAASSY